MLHRGTERFRILQVLLIVAGLALAGRVVQIQIFQHKRHLERAQVTWSDDISINPERGNLYDKSMRPLALSVAAWRVGVATSLMDENPGKLCGMLGEILERDPQALEKELVSARGKHVVVAANKILTRDQSMRLQGVKAITLEDLRARVYPYDGMAASLIGFHRQDKEGDFSTGLEYSLRGYLDGSPGRARLISTGNLGENLGQVVVAEARHGQSLVLSLDTDLQEICEKQLESAVKATGSEGGSVLVLDPDTGDVLAAASWPLLDSRKGRHGDASVWNNRNFTHMYEPGSVFKIFSAASLLRHGAIDTAMAFDCSDSDFGGFTIRNDEGHVYGNLSFMKAFSKSSNIFFARAVGNLKSEELYHDLLDFGFGQGTSFPYPACPDGILKSPGLWSGRSKPTIAIGQEVAVTPLQLGLAVCAVANGGTLYSPRLIREVRDDRGKIVEVVPPRPLRKVMSEPLAELLLQAMAEVVDHGTGIGAKECWVNSGGKTGTAQKSRDGHGYSRGAYIASFSGIVPLEDPRLVILTVLDEPKGIKHYASLSAVPLYREIVRDIRSGTDYLTDAPGTRTALLELSPSRKMVGVPDVLHLSLENAGLRLGAVGLKMSGAERGGMVIQQVPPAGTRMTPGSEVRLMTGPETTETLAAGAICPDFSGLSNRQVNSLAARMGLKVQIKGAGYAVSQTPAPGLSLSGRKVKVRMEARW
jgi:stage V sporulation protein D (sporulation-specific penicillin-binding protein)